MLFAVEGGGFFSSSASGYCKGLALLLLGQRSEEKPMRVTPLTQYRLVDQETVSDLQLASKENLPVSGCASLVCFGCTAAGLESPSPLKVGPTQSKEVLQPHIVDDSKDSKISGGCVGLDDDNDDSKASIFNLKSNLKKAENNAAIASTDGSGKNNKHKTLFEENESVASQMERRKVQWTDINGGELFEIREFEMSADGSDSDFDRGNEKTCSCSIM